MTIRNQSFITLLLCAVSLFVAGCASTPVSPGLPTYTLHGTSYLPLVSLCDLKGIKWEYDTYTHSVSLSRGTHRAYLKVGDTLALVDGRPQDLTHPVDLYKGAVVVPVKFQERVLAPWLQESLAVTRPAPEALKIKKIIIDAGHGGNDPGAVGRSGLREKDINLDIAKRLEKILRDNGIATVLTRSTDRFIPLERRVQIANQSGADLFVSIHTNANRVRSLNGFEVYYVSNSVSDTKRALSAADARPNVPPGTLEAGSPELTAVLWDMIYTCSRAESIELARAICRSVGGDLEAKILGVKAAGFYVLKGARMPAVLVEIGFVSNSSEERMLKNNYYRQQVADALSRGIVNYSREYSLLGSM